MRSAIPLSAIASALPARRAALACLLLAVLGLGASLVLAPPIDVSTSPASWRQMLPLAASLLGLLAGGLALSARQPEPVDPPEDPRQASLLAALQRTVAELRDVTDAQRSELVSLREQYGEATREAMMVSARLAGVALDAESRLSAGVAQAQQALQRPSDELTDLLRRNLDRPPIPPDETAAQLRAAADGMVQTISQAVATAAGQIEALGTAGGKLQRDATALTTAGHEIATAGATVVARLSEAATRANGVLAALPVVGATVTDAAAALEENGRRSLAAVDRLQQESATLRSAAEDAAARITAAADQAVAGADSALNALPKATAELIDAAAGLARNTASFGAEAASGEAALRALPEATEALRAVAAALDEKAGTMSRSLDRIEAAASDLTGAAESLHGEGARLSEASSEAARTAGALAQQTEALRDVAGDAATRTEAAIADLPGLAGGLTEVAASLDAAGRQMVETSRGMAELLAADAERSEAIRRALPEASAALSEAASSVHTEATSLEEAARRISHVGGEAVAAIADTVAQAAAVAQALDTAGRESAAATKRLEQQTEALQASSQSAATRIEAAADRADTAHRTLSELSTGLSETAGGLQRDVVALDGAGRQLALAGQTLSLRLADDAARSEALLHALPQAVAGLSAATGALHTDAEALQAASREITGTGSEVAAAVGAAMDKAAGVVQGLDASGRDAIAATLRLQQQTVSLQATSDMAATRIATAADQAAAMASDAAAALSRDSAALDAVGQLVSGLPDATAALAEAARHIRQVGETAAAVIDDTATQLTQAGHLVPLLDQAGREAASATRDLHQQTDELQAAAASVTSAGRKIADLLSADAARSDAVLRALPEATAVLSEAAATMQARTGAMEDAARRVASVSGEAVAVIADTLTQSAHVAQSLDVSGREAAAAARLLQQQNEALQSAAEAAVSNIAAAANGAVEMAARAFAALPDLTSGFSEAGGAIADAAARAESGVAGLDSASRVLCAAAAEAAAQIERLGGLANDTEGRLAVLQTVGSAIGETVEGLSALGRQLEQATVALPAAVASLADHAASEPAQAASLATLAGLPEKFRDAAARLESAIARQDGASVILESAMTRVQGAFEAVAQASRPAPEQDALGATLQHLGGVEQAAVLLLQQAEALAEAVLDGRAPELPGVLAERTPSLLAGLDATIGRLRSAATALALASDGPSVQPEARKRGPKGAA